MQFLSNSARLAGARFRIPLPRLTDLARFAISQETSLATENYFVIRHDSINLRCDNVRPVAHAPSSITFSVNVVTKSVSRRRRRRISFVVV